MFSLCDRAAAVRSCHTRAARAPILSRNKQLAETRSARSPQVTSGLQQDRLVNEYVFRIELDVRKDKERSNSCAPRLV